MFFGEPQVGGAQLAPTYETHFWNLSTGTTADFPNVIGEHDIQYDPVNNTFLTLQQYVQPVGNNLYLIDQIVELDQTATYYGLGTLTITYRSAMLHRTTKQPLLTGKQ